MPDAGYKQLMHKENDLVALETVLSFDSEEDRHDLCEILDTLSAGCELDSTNFNEDQLTLYIKHSQNVAHLLKRYYLTKVFRASEDAGMPGVSPTQTLKDELQSDRINFYVNRQPWGNHIMLPERKPQEFEKVLGFKTRREAESVLRVLNIMMYGNSVAGEAQHLEVFQKFVTYGRVLRNWFWFVQIHSREHSILSMTSDKANILYKRHQSELDTLIEKQETGLVATPKVYMKPKQVARMQELRGLIDTYLNDQEAAKQERLGETNPIDAPIIRTAPADPKAVAAAAESIASTGCQPPGGRKKKVSVLVAPSPAVAQEVSTQSSSTGVSAPKATQAVPTEQVPIIGSYISAPNPPKVPGTAKAKAKAKTPTKSLQERNAEKLLKLQLHIHRVEAGEFGTKKDTSFRERGKTRFDDFRDKHMPISGNSRPKVTKWYFAVQEQAYQDEADAQLHAINKTPGSRLSINDPTHDEATYTLLVITLSGHAQTGKICVPYVLNNQVRSLWIGRIFLSQSKGKPPL